MEIESHNHTAASRIFGCKQCKTRLSTGDKVLKKVSVLFRALPELCSREE